MVLASVLRRSRGYRWTPGMPDTQRVAMCPFSFWEGMSPYELKDKKGVHNK